MLTRYHVSITSTSDENVRRRRHIFYRLYSVPVHTLKYCYGTGNKVAGILPCLKSTNWVNFCN